MYRWKIIKIQEVCTHFAFSGTARRYQQESYHSTRLAFGSPFLRQHERLSRDIGRCQRRCPSLTFLGIGGAKPRTLTCTASRRELSRGCSHFDVSSWWCTAHPSVTPAPQPLMNSTSGRGGEAAERPRSRVDYCLHSSSSPIFRFSKYGLPIDFEITVKNTQCYWIRECY